MAISWKLGGLRNTKAAIPRRAREARGRDVLEVPGCGPHGRRSCVCRKQAPIGGSENPGDPVRRGAIRPTRRVGGTDSGGRSLAGPCRARMCGRRGRDGADRQPQGTRIISPWVSFENAYFFFGGHAQRRHERVVFGSFLWTLGSFERDRHHRLGMVGTRASLTSLEVRKWCDLFYVAGKHAGRHALDGGRPRRVVGRDDFDEKMDGRAPGSLGAKTFAWPWRGGLTQPRVAENAARPNSAPAVAIFFLAARPGSRLRGRLVDIFREGTRNPPGVGEKRRRLHSPAG